MEIGENAPILHLMKFILIDWWERISSVNPKRKYEVKWKAARGGEWRRRGFQYAKVLLSVSSSSSAFESKRGAVAASFFFSILKIWIQTMSFRRTKSTYVESL